MRYVGVLLGFLTSILLRLGSLSQQKTHFCLPTKVRFLNDVCLRQMMTASPMMMASRMMCALRHIGANIASLRNGVEQHHFERSEKHHIAERRCIIDDIQGCALICR